MLGMHLPLPLTGAVRQQKTSAVFATGRIRAARSEPADLPFSEVPHLGAIQRYCGYFRKAIAFARGKAGLARALSKNGLTTLYVGGKKA